jgi:hypothetical protein
VKDPKSRPPAAFLYADEARRNAIASHAVAVEAPARDYRFLKRRRGVRHGRIRAANGKPTETIEGPQSTLSIPRKKRKSSRGCRRQGGLLASLRHLPPFARLAFRRVVSS